MSRRIIATGRTATRKRTQHCPSLDRELSVVTEGGYSEQATASASMLRLRHFFSSSTTALVIPIIPVRMVGSGTGANLLECKLGNGVPLFFDSATFAGSTAPTTNMNAGRE